MNSVCLLTVYFDASCRLCNSEMQNIKLHDPNNHIHLIDCSSPDFDDTQFKAIGISREDMMNCLHLQTPDGQWLKGVSAFELLYRSVGLDTIARLWGHPWLKPINERLYPWVVRHRYILSKLGLPALFTWWGKRAAKRAEQRSRLCRDNRCNLDN